MRDLSDSERDYLIAYWFTEPLVQSIAIPERFKEGFIAGLDYSATLTAERDGLAADVVAQRGQNAKLRAALKPFAEYAATLTNWDSDPVIVARWRGVIVTAGDFRKVAEVLGEPPTT